MQRKIRSFIAVELSPDVRGRAQQLIQRLRVTDARVHWVENQNLHLTLKFLGEIESLEIPGICRQLQQAVAEIESFDLEFHGVGAFPDASNPRTIWLGVRAGGEAMVALHQRVEGALTEFGFRVEGRRFRPHVTLGRVRDTRHGKRDLENLINLYDDAPGGISHCDEVVLFASLLEGDGQVYEPLGRAELGSAIGEDR